MAGVVIVGVDGSEHAGRAIDWCVRHADALDVEVVAVHVAEIPLDFGRPGNWKTMPTEDELGELAEHVKKEWCRPLEEAGVPYRVVVKQGYPAVEIMQVAKREGAELVVTGRRGLGGFKELVLGSTSHYLSHHLDRPLLIVP